MKLFKKILITLIAICLFIAATIGFTNMLRSFRVPVEEVSVSQRMDAYPRALTEPAEEAFTLPVPTVPQATAAATAVPETIIAETAVPETAASETTAETITAETYPAETTPAEVPLPMDLSSVPLLYMSDYPDVRYLTGSLATSGSNVASLAMVASYLTGYEYRPDVLMDYFADYIGNSMQWLEYASDQLRLPWTNSGNFHDVVKALEDGKIAIIVMGERTFYTENLHFLVLTGIDEQGNIRVNDPLESHYTHWNLSEKLKTGFTVNSLIGGYKGGWIFDPEEMPEEPFVYAPEENTDEFRYPGIELTDAEIELMAKVICTEAQSEPFDGQQAIAEVILNRLVSENFPDTIRSIVHAQDQFRGVSQLYRATPTHIQYEAVKRALNGPYILDKEVVFFAGYSVTSNVWGTIGAHTFCYPE